MEEGGEGGMKQKKILIINICKETLHYYEFVKPVEDIVKSTGEKYIVKHYTKINSQDLKKTHAVIICGTSLQDNDFMNHVHYFSWLKNFDGAVLGICGGMQIMGVVFGGKGLLQKKTEIGYYGEKFVKNFLGLLGEMKVYHLHNYYVDFSLLDDFEIFAGKNIAQAVKHRWKKIYGALFHPEVRNKEVIKNFIKTFL